MFSDVFEFNPDGNINLFDLAFGHGGMLFSENKMDIIDEENFSGFLDDEADDELLQESSINDLEWERGILAYRLSELRDKLFDLADEEPDDYIDTTFERWERRKNQLDEQIFELEDRIAEIEDMMAFNAMGVHAQAV